MFYFSFAYGLIIHAVLPTGEFLDKEYEMTCKLLIDQYVRY